jgi:transcriptional regulator with XRE-family HTH domain
VWREVVQQRRDVKPGWSRNKLHYALISHLISVAERAVDHVTAPVLSQALDVGKDIDDPRRSEDSPSDDRVTSHQGKPEVAILEALDIFHSSVEDLTAVAAHLLSSDRGQVLWWATVVAEVGVHVSGRSVSGFTCIDHDHRSPLPRDLQRAGETRGGPADDRKIAPTLYRPGAFVAAVVVLMSHARYDTFLPPNGNIACSIRKMEMSVDQKLGDVEQIVRIRLRSLRTTLGLSLDQLSERTHLSPSTISRVETGKRTISLDILLPLARALQIDLDALLDVHTDDDVIIRPSPRPDGTRTTWMLSRSTGSTVAMKLRLEPAPNLPELRVHPGHDWFFVLEGRVQLRLGDREILVQAGEAAEFTTMTPHAVSALDGPAELLMVFDRDGHLAHTHR